MVLALVALSCVSRSGEVNPEEVSPELASTVASVGYAGEEVKVVRTSPVLTVSETSVVSETISETEGIVYRDGREYLSGCFSSV